MTAANRHSGIELFRLLAAMAVMSCCTCFLMHYLILPSTAELCGLRAAVRRNMGFCVGSRDERAVASSIRGAAFAR